MPLVRVLSAPGCRLPAMRPLYGKLCELFKVTPESRVLQVSYHPNTEMQPDPLVFDIRAKAKPDRTPDEMAKVMTGLESFAADENCVKPRVRIELFDPSLAHSNI
eukprot:TRINITY_DN5815_c0_g2_i1.p3 TRINITY_DN5815_c0_g2~~TRINITY_DN5815_c0_g2_i1.p3  ORF type:complete len:123 (+),score=33.31 TRINITY_DN5815_c0_g2_i1:55-369(+)